MREWKAIQALREIDVPALRQENLSLRAKAARLEKDNLILTKALEQLRG